MNNGDWYIQEAANLSKLDEYSLNKSHRDSLQVISSNFEAISNAFRNIKERLDKLEELTVLHKLSKDELEEIRKVYNLDGR